MELALYCPVYGYYEAEKDTVGRTGDFYTSVSVGSLFGQLLAFQFAAWLEQMPDKDCRLQLAEAGAHNGQLAKDILECFETKFPALFSRIEYIIIEPSPVRRKWQEKALAKFDGKVSWVNELAGLNINGVIFSNELLDAFPIQRFGWDAQQKQWFEWGVTKDGARFAWARMPGTVANLCPPELEAVLPDGYIVEKSPAAEDWWRNAARVLRRGKLMAIDYGLTEAELFSPERTNGTLRGYHRHHATSDVLADPGEQDLTAHVNFPAIKQVGENEGLHTDRFFRQSMFLMKILNWDVKRQEIKMDQKFGRQLQSLIHPEHLGRAFRVLIQSRNI